MTESAHRASSTQAAHSQHSIASHSISMADYVTAVLAFVRGELPAQETSNFCDFFKLTSCNFTTFFSFLAQANICFLDVLNEDNYS